MTFPRLRALNEAWLQVPPVAITLRRISSWLGLPAPQSHARPSTPQRVEDVVKEVTTAGLPVMQGRPDDPMLALCGL